MTRIKQIVACVASVLAMGFSQAAADVIEFQVAKVRLYEQTTASAPVSALYYIFDSYVDLSSPADASSVTLDGDPLTDDYPGEWEINEMFASQGELDTARPGFVFDLHIQGGTLGARDETVTLSSPAIYPAPPAFTPTSFNDAQDADSTQDLLLQWTAPDASANMIFFSIIDITTDMDLFDDLLPISSTSYLINALMLDPEHEYEVELVFANGNQFLGQPNPGFGTGADGLTGYASVTLMSFTTAPLAQPGVVDFWLTKVRDYQQVSQSPPTTPFEYVLDAVINMAPGDAASATLNAIPMTEIYPGEWEIFTGFADQASLNAVMPGSSMNMFQIQGGTLGTLSEDAPLNADVYPAPPALTPSSFNAVQNIDTTQDLLVDWITPDASTDFTFFAIYDINTDTCILDMFFPFVQANFLIPANSLNPNTDYEIELGFINGLAFTGQPAPGFGTQAQGLTGHAAITLVNFTTAPVGCVDVGIAGVIKEITYQQTLDNTPPAVPSLYRFDAFMDTIDGGVALASISNGLSTVPMVEDEPGLWDADNQANLEFASKAALDAVYPSALSYNIHIEGGTLGTRDQSVLLSADDYPNTPYLIGSGYTDITNLDPTQAITVDWILASPNTTHLFFEIYNNATHEKTYEAEFPPATTSITIPADTLTAGVEYELDVNFLAAPQDFASDCPGFGLGSAVFTGFVSSTSVYFTPIAPCPADLTGDGALDFFDVSDFLLAYSTGNLVADFTGDGTLDFFDVSDFLLAFSTGCP